MSRLGERRRRPRDHARSRTVGGPPRCAPAASGVAEVEFVKISPTGNMTLLVSSVHPVADYRSIAGQLLPTGHVHAEQVGFVQRPSTSGAHARLHMAGDEFCGNACMALAALTAAEQGLAMGDPVEIVLEASDSRQHVVCRVERRTDGLHAELTMPLPERIEPHPFPGISAGRSTLVRYTEAAHLVVECAPQDPETRHLAEQVAVQLAATEALPLVGVMLYDAASGDLAPLVNVPALGSLVWEQSCGSGTASVGAHLAATSDRPVQTSVHQPGGTMQVTAVPGAEGIASLRIGGEVRIVAEGTAYVHV